MFARNQAFPLLFLCLLLLATSCAKLSYMVEQGQGQLSLLYRARDNSDVLSDASISSEVKEQIRDIESYKRFFYRLMKRDATDIYSQTTFLKGEAITHLVVASPINEIKAHKECFPFGGCFPYLGFFERQSAKRYAEKLEQQDLVTMIRPVYAYSTTGHLDDPILSSFFRYEQEELAELIFHELLHTILFIKNEVELNENLATYIGEQLVARYFKYTDEQKRESQRKLEASRFISQRIVHLVKNLSAHYLDQRVGPNEVERAQVVLDNFLAREFTPAITKECERFGIAVKKCYPLHREWSNAAFAAVMTYQSRGDRIAKLHKSLNCSLAEFVSYIEQRYQKYLKTDAKEEFTEFLFR
jgi:predicted aminopeptidase